VNVSVPETFDEDEKYGVSLALGNGLRPATRAECRTWASAQVKGPKAQLKEEMLQIRKQFGKEAKA